MILTQKEKAVELVGKFKFKFIACLYCDFYIWLIGSTYLKSVKIQIKKL